MILPIGNSRKSHPLLSVNQKGFTFIEIMVTMIILSLGIVTIFQGFLVSLDRMSYLTHRLYATNVLDNRIAHIERTLQVYSALPFELPTQEEVAVGNKIVVFNQTMSIDAVEDFPDVFRLNLSLSWKEGARLITLSRSAYLSDFDPLY